MSYTINIYLDHFSLKERPFSLVPDPDFIFWSQAHKRAYAMFEYGIVTRSPITLITGEIGAGKTTLVHHLLKSLGEDVDVGLISNASGSRREMLHWIMKSLDQPVVKGAEFFDILEQFQKLLVTRYSEGRRVILVFDEAQNLKRSALEELRMLTNINSNKDELLQLVLVGQPELRKTVHHPKLMQFAQRVAANFHLTALDQKGVARYIRHRLQVAGAKDAIFTDDACLLVHSMTDGVPRLINQLCDLALLYAYTDDQQNVTEATVLHVLEDGVFFGGGGAGATE